jgi:polyisoprenoid-binding protein YceI
MKKMFVLAGVLLSLSGVSLQAAQYKIDPDHSTIGFKVRHLLGKVNGRFDKYEGSFTYDKTNPSAWKTQATIDAASINTNTAKRDEHLRSADFFEVKTYPTLTFVSTKVTDIKNNHAKLHGKLMIHGVTKPVVLDLEILGEAKDPWGNEQASFVATTKINRQDYGLTWNQAIETGGVLVGDEIEITLEIEGIKQK